MMRLWCLVLVSVLMWAAGTGVCPAEAVFQYWTELQLINLTGYPIKVKKLQMNYPDGDVTPIKVGTVIPAEDPDNPSQEPVMIGKVNKYSRGVTIKFWFELVGNEGKEDCYLYINNPYTGNNSITPRSYFPEAQCPSIVPADVPEAQATPLYHNIQLPSSGHKLELVAVLAFQDLFKEGSVVEAGDEAAVVEQGNEQIDQAESDRVRFMQETGMSLSGPR